MVVGCVCVCVCVMRFYYTNPHTTHTYCCYKLRQQGQYKGECRKKTDDVKGQVLEKMRKKKEEHEEDALSAREGKGESMKDSFCR